MDGTGEPAHTREAKLGCVFTRTKRDAEGYPICDPDSTTYVGAIETAEEFGKRLYPEAWDLARKLRPNDEANQNRWTMIHQDLLDEGRIEKPVTSLRSIETSNAEPAEKIRTEAEYFENAERMRYPEFRRQHLFVGRVLSRLDARPSSVRCRQSGMFWTVRGANAILALRRGEFNGRFEDDREARRA
jgi:hypothetical protein